MDAGGINNIHNNMPGFGDSLSIGAGSRVGVGHHHQQQEQQRQVGRTSTTSTTSTSSSARSIASSEDTLLIDGIASENPAYTACKIWCHPKDLHTGRELKSLPLEEREKVWGDMSGDSSLSHYQINPEQPEFVQQCLEQLQMELNKISTSEKLAYEYALTTNPDYVLDQSRTLMFLRSEGFDPKLTAKHIIGHYDLKQELFGQDKVGRDILLNDLSNDDIESLESGGFQYLDRTDHAGRPICFSRLSAMKAKTAENACRAIWYNAQIASRNERYQKLGAVCVPFMMDDFPKGGIDYDFIRKTSKVGVYGFMRIVSAYILCRSPAWNGLTDLLTFLFGNRIKLRTRPIGGTLQECQYKLMCIGIPPSCLPVNNYGAVDNSRLHRWVADRRWREQQQTLVATRSMSMIPFDDDENDVDACSGSNVINSNDKHSSTVSDDDDIECSMDMEELDSMSPTTRQDTKRVRRTYYGSGSAAEEPSIISSGSKTGNAQRSQGGADLGSANPSCKSHVVHRGNRTL